MMDGWRLFRGRHYHHRGRGFALRAGFHEAQPPQAGTPASIFLAMWLNLQWQCKCSASRVEYIRERTSLRIILPSVARPENALGDVRPVDEAKRQRRTRCEPFLTLTDFYICLTHLRTRLTLQALQPQSSHTSTLTSTEASVVLSPYQLGTLRTRTMSLPPGQSLTLAKLNTPR